MLGNLGGTLFNTGKIAQSESVYAELRRQFPNAQAGQSVIPAFMYHRGELDSVEAFWRGRRTDPNPVTRLSALGNLSVHAMLRGRLRESYRLGVESRRQNETRGVPSSPYADAIASAGIDIWFLERDAQGARTLDSALARVPLRTVPIDQRPDLTIATYYAWAGEPARARSILDGLDADLRDTTLRTAFENGKHAVLAEIAIAEGRPLDAVRSFWKTDSLPDGPPSDCAACLYPSIGRAYDVAEMPDSAIAYFERYLATPHIGRLSQDASYLAAIRKRLGELYEARGDTQKAASNYMAFIELWEKADPELQPKVHEVRKRLAGLREVGGR